MGVQGDGIWTGTNGDSVLVMQIVYDLVALSGGDDLDYPEAGNTINEWTGESRQWVPGRKAVKNGGCN